MKRHQAERRAELVRAMPGREGVLFLKGKNYEKLVQIRANSCKFFPYRTYLNKINQRVAFRREAKRKTWTTLQLIRINP